MVRQAFIIEESPKSLIKLDIPSKCKNYADLDRYQLETLTAGIARPLQKPTEERFKCIETLGDLKVKGRRILPPALHISTARRRCIDFLKHHPWSVLADDSSQRILHKNKFFAVYITRQKISVRRQRQECVEAKKKRKNIRINGKNGKCDVLAPSVKLCRLGQISTRHRDDRELQDPLQTPTEEQFKCIETTFLLAGEFESQIQKSPISLHSTSQTLDGAVLTF
ncbi:hypothetical protein CEXT_248771 [Caerostris extrusa]|uniref:Uncharacterized protein n=1 Tax=Caerostris extrusa TaxID=172846 RepID=A0AAV4RVD2_CAEEX|nr:hypothetical protein CEXT_248771 [Caerostris extrusa]